MTIRAANGLAQATGRRLPARFASGVLVLNPDSPTMHSLSASASSPGEGYRRHFLRQDRGNFALLVGLGIVFNCLLIKADAVFLQQSELFWGLLALRLGVIGLSALTLAIVLRTDEPARFDRWCFVWSLACVLLNTLVILTRPAAYTDHVVVDLFIIVAWYAVLPGPTFHRVLPPLLLTLGSLALFFAIKFPIGVVATLSTVTTYLAANIVGLSISTTWHRYRKASFAAGQTLEQLYREAEEGRLAAQSAEQTWERIIDASPNLLFVIDRQYRIRRVNQAALGRLGRPRAEVLGQPCFSFLCGHPLPPDGCLHARVLADHQPHRLEARLALLGCDCQIMAAPLFDQQGGYEATVYIVQDISAQKQQQQELDSARRTAEEAHAVKSEFLALISHEIRTPLNALVGFSSLARKADDPGTVRHYLDIIDQSSRMLTDLVNDILDLSKIEAGRLSLDISSFNLTDTIDVLVWHNRALAAQKGLDFEVIRGEGLPGWIEGDPMRLRQILANLIANAIKFTPAGRVTLTVTAMPDGPRSLIRFGVHDTGIGIAKEKQAQLFQPFHQLDPSISRKFGGTGLGLAIVERLVTLMKGRIEVASAKGQGSCFTVELPMVTGAPPACPILADSDRPGLDILVVEDNAFNRLLLCDTLTHWNHRVTPANGGRQALALTEQCRYHLIIVDIRMPDLDGIGLTRCVRQRERERGLGPVPIIAYTADTETETREQCLAVGMVAVLYKPLDSAQLALAIGTYCPLTAGSDPAATAMVGELGLAERVRIDMGADTVQLQMYLLLLRADIEEELQRLDRALVIEDRQTLMVAAHSLKGLCGSLQDPLPATLSQQLHQGADTLPLASLRPLAQRLHLACAGTVAIQ